MWRAGSGPMRSLYFTYYLGIGLFLPYLGLYFRAIHFSGAQIGLAASLIPLAGGLLPPFWGMLSDRYALRKPILAGALAAAALFALLVPLAGSYLALLPLILGMAVALSPVVPLADATTLEWLRRHGGSYGNIRIFGSIGFLFSTVAAGSLFDGRRILWLFALYSACLGATFLVSLLSPGQKTAARPSGGEGLRVVLGDRTLVLFLLCTMVGYGTAAAYNTFFPLYLKDLGAGTRAVGIASGIATASELPAMWLAGRLMARIGVRSVLLLGLAASVVRWLAYALIADWRLALPFQLLHGATFALFYVAGVTFVDMRVPAHLRATGQTLFNGAAFGLGLVVQSNLYGLIYDRAHAHGVYLVAAALAALALLAMARCVPRASAELAPAA